MEQMMEQLDCLLENNKSKPGREYSNSTQKKKILKVKNSFLKRQIFFWELKD